MVSHEEMMRGLMVSRLRREIAESVEYLGVREIMDELEERECSLEGSVIVLRDRLVRALFREVEPNNTKIPWYLWDRDSSTVQRDSEGVRKRPERTEKVALGVGAGKSPMAQLQPMQDSTESSNDGGQPVLRSMMRFDVHSPPQGVYSRVPTATTTSILTSQASKSFTATPTPSRSYSTPEQRISFPAMRSITVTTLREEQEPGSEMPMEMESEEATPQPETEMLSEVDVEKGLRMSRVRERNSSESEREEAKQREDAEKRDLESHVERSELRSCAQEEEIGSELVESTDQEEATRMLRVLSLHQVTLSTASVRFVPINREFVGLEKKRKKKKNYRSKGARKKSKNKENAMSKE